MPAPDPIPPLGPLKKRFLGWMRLAAVFSLGAASLAVVLAISGERDPRVQKLVAVALAVGLFALAGVSLMTITHLRNRKSNP